MPPQLNIALIAEQQSTYVNLGYSEEDCAALTHDGERQAVSTALEQLGHRVTLVPGIQSLVQHLAEGKHKQWDLAFNMSQGFYGSARESQVPALLEAYQVPYTFADAETMALCQNKANTKITLAYHGIPTAPFSVIPNTSSPSFEFTKPLPYYPLFVKPATEGSSKGIEHFNKVNEPADLEPTVQRLQAKFPGQDILVESFLPGKEFTVGILGTGADSRVVGITEFIWQKSSPSASSASDSASGSSSDGSQQSVGNELQFASRLSKSSKGEALLVRDYSHDMSDPYIKAASQVALDAWTVFGCRDAGRVDIRFDSHGPDAVPNILEVNPISGLLPGHSPLPASAEENGIPFEKLLGGIVESALKRASKSSSASV